MKRIFVTKKLEETLNIAEKTAKEILSAADKNKSPSRSPLKGRRDGRNSAIVIGLTGDLGGGKTSFAQGFAKGLGVKQKVRSPTFVVMKKYKISLKSPAISGQTKTKKKKSYSKSLKTKDSRLTTLIHIDAYRLKSGDDLRALGWDEIIKNPRNIILIEWPENIKEAMPKKYGRIEFEHRGGDERKIKISF